MSEDQCKSCQYYIQHYTFDKKRIVQVYCGHCTYSRPKHKRPDGKVCENYVAGTAKEDLFVTKEYLSKELLQYMLRLELLPEIEERRWGIRYAFLPQKGKNNCSHQFLNWWQQLSTGQLHLDRVLD